jgi:hypothetical protein
LAITFAACGSHAFAINILAPGDYIIPIDSDPWTGGSDNNWPDGEAPSFAVDGDATTKYLNFSGPGSGIIVTPADSTTTVQSLRLTTGNDPGAWWRTPTWVNVFGTNSALVSGDRTSGDLETWNLIGSIPMGGAYALAGTANTPGPVIPLPNNSAYAHYKVEFPSLTYPYWNGGATEIGEIELFESTDGSGTSVLTNPTNVYGIWNRRSESDSPGNESPLQLLDTAAGTKYLNFGKENSGFIVTPNSGPEIVTSFRIQTANDAPERDPASYIIYGTNDSIQSLPHSQGSGETWTQLDAGSLLLGDARGAYSDTIDFANTQAWSSYKIVFPTLKNSTTANSMQIAGLTLNTSDTAVLVVDRQTGQVAIETTDSMTFGGYEIISETFGVLRSESWNSLASTGADPNDTWTVTSETPNLLAEEMSAGGAGNGFQISPNSPLNLGSILPIVPTQFEDLTFNLYGTDRTTIVSQRVTYEGTPIPLGDYSGNGTVGIEDYNLFLEVYGSQFQRGVDSQLTRYLGGDLDGDFDSDITDYRLFVQYAGGMGALFGTQVPEPSTVLLLTLGAVAAVGARRVRRGAALLMVSLATVLFSSSADAQMFSIAAPGQPITVTEPEGQLSESAETTAAVLFDDAALDQLPLGGDGSGGGELFRTNYDTTTVNYWDFRSLIDQGAPLESPVYVFMDYGSPITTDWFMYAQRSGGNYGADRVGKFEFWFQNTPFGAGNNTIPIANPQATVNIAPTDNRLVTSTLYPYTLGGEHTGQYVAMRLTLSELSAAVSGTNRPGGHEFRFLNGPTDLVLEVDRASGELTLKNNLSGAIPINMSSYEISSPSGALDASGFDGLGDNTGFTGWSTGGGSNEFRLVDGNFANLGADSVITVGATGLSLGTGLNSLLATEDLIFTWTDSLGRYFDARVVYVGEFPDTLVGDYNSDGVVNLADYTVWRDNLGSTVVLPNDATPGVVDASDYENWKSNFGSMAPVGTAASTAVPEPSTVGVAFVALACLAGFARSKRRSSAN